MKNCRYSLLRVLSRMCLLFFPGLLFLTPLAQASDACKNLVVTGNPEYPPFLWRDPDDDSRLIGANADLMQLLAKEIGVTVEVKYVGPWGRVQEEARLGRVDLLAGAFFTVSRLEYMDYFYPSLKETRSVIWTRSNVDLHYKKWADLGGRQGVTVINNSFGEEFDRYARESLKIASVASLEQALKMLSMGRADYLVYEEDPGLAYVAKLNLSGLKTLMPAIANENLYLTMAHKSACNTPEMRGKIAKAVYKFSKLNLIDKLIENNIQLWRKQAH